MNSIDHGNQHQSVLMPYAGLNSPLEWLSATCELARQLQKLDDPDLRVQLLESLCHRLGQDRYPRFLQLLIYSELHTDAQSKHLLTDTLAFAINTGRLPSGTLPAWGSTTQTPSIPYCASRTLGPIEFLCAWYAQPTYLPELPDEVFDIALSALLRLMDSNSNIRKLYCCILNPDTINDSIGVFSSVTRNGIRRLAKNWNAKGSSEELAAQFIVDIKTSQARYIQDQQISY